MAYEIDDREQQAVTDIARLSGKELIEITLDAESFSSWDIPCTEPNLGEEYAAQLEKARKRSGVDESVLTGSGSLHARRVAVIVSEFAFMAGSIGVAAAKRISSAIRRATEEGIPILAAPASGGTRMQEGTVAFLHMATITEAVTAHKRAGLPFLVYLRHPTTGGVFASWGSLGHITVAEPNALIGFLGPKVYRALEGEDFPTGVQTGENLFAKGIVDAVLAPHHLRNMISQVLGIIALDAPIRHTPTPSDDKASEPHELTAWGSVAISRRNGRPGVRSLLRHATTAVTFLSGTGQGESDKSVLVALASFSGRGVIVIGLDRHAQHHDEQLGPGALREARRAMELADELHLPLVTVIDTPGAALSRAAEEGGLGGEIARCLATLLNLQVPIVSVIMGQGAGGGALALVPADRVLAAQHGWLSPLPPEGASAIRYGDTSHASAMAVSLGIRAGDLVRHGIVDEIIPEIPDAADESAAFCYRLGLSIERHLDALAEIADTQVLLRERHQRYASLGD